MDAFSRRGEQLTADRVVAVVRRVAARFRSVPAHTREDLGGVAALAVVEAHHRFDQSRGVPWEAYAYRRAVGAVQDYLRAAPGWDRAAGERAAVLVELDDALAKPSEGMPVDEVVAVRWAWDRIRPRDRAVLARTVIRRDRGADVARDLGVTPSALTQHKQAALDRMRVWVT